MPNQYKTKDTILKNIITNISMELALDNLGLNPNIYLTADEVCIELPNEETAMKMINYIKVDESILRCEIFQLDIIANKIMIERVIHPVHKKRLLNVDLDDYVELYKKYIE